jgi:hypothetical protein
MIYQVLADNVLVIHLLFIVFVVLGGLLVLWKRRIAWLHIPAAVWGALIEFMGWYCPLTPLENHLRQLGGQSGYEGGFIAHYLLPVVYPEGLTREIQLVLGSIVVVVNLGVYGYAFYKTRRQSDKN